MALVEVLQKRKLKHNKRPQSQPHALENITIALDAIQDDGIKLVNIGEENTLCKKPAHLEQFSWKTTSQWDQIEVYYYY